MSAGAQDEAAHFVDKWRARWPEWTVAEVFVPAPERAAALAWAALQQEWMDAAWAGDDARPGLAKLAWWQDELRGWDRGLRRHPLAPALRRDGLSWMALADALDALPASRERARDLADARRVLAPLASAAATLEAARFGGVADAGAVAMCWLSARALHQGEPAVPLSVLASAEGDAAASQWREQLKGELHTTRDAPRVRRLWAGLSRARLGRPQGAPLGPLPALLAAWRAARN